MPIGPSNIPQERAPYSYAEKGAANLARRGPLRFEEGIATDTPQADDFQWGMRDGYLTDPSTPNRVNAQQQYKHADVVMRERAHVGSASWIDAPGVLGEFVGGVTEPPIQFPVVRRSGGRYERRSATVIGSENPNTPYDRL